ncbi:hypothetical protein BDV93DRAFT_470665 [Ceratobasidium sp. AG-I]|nr:hypothetical protein BDV93DRAFT_470665 [Ceratobasidium sp. AG-I]
MSEEKKNIEYVTDGYYRYTDIIFEWWQVITDLGDRSALKAFLHTDSLVSDECPWHPGKQGIELFMGTLLNGENRLLFSLKQIEYCRYWLKAYGLTTDLLPLPSLHYILTSSDLRTQPSPATYKTVAELRNALKDVSKNNKRVKMYAGDIALGDLRTVFERVRTVWGEKRGVWMAIDFEGWEREHTIITEFGWSVVRWEEAEEEEKKEGEGEKPAVGETKWKEVRDGGHWTVKEYAGYRNGTFVRDNRDHYDFGETEVLSKATFKKRIGDMIAGFAAQGPLYLIFHDRYGDVKYLQQLEVPGISDIASIPKQTPGPGIYCIDTKDMFSALEGNSAQKRGLDRVCLLLKLPRFEHPHNAGNDAHYTMEVLRAMATGQPLDLQREARWPNQTEVFFGQQKGVKVEFTEQDEESDWDDY